MLLRTSCFEPSQLCEFENRDLVLFLSDYFTKTDMQAYKTTCPNIQAVISGNMVSHDLNSVDFYGAPAWLEKWIKPLLNISYETPTQTTNCFYFFINKKQVNRFCLMKLVEWFDLTCYDYTWSGQGKEFDMTEILQELNSIGADHPLNQQIKPFILEPINLEKKFIAITPTQMKIDSSVSLSNDRGTALDWHGFMKDLSMTSAVSLIAESVLYDRAMMFTEKTVYSVLGCNFPIWIGGYNQAKAWNNLGFDTFDDIIDHSYQCFPTLIERIYYAFERNLEILSNLDLAQNLRNTHMPRLLANRQLLVDDHLSRCVTQITQTWPGDIQSLIRQHQLFDY